MINIPHCIDRFTHQAEAIARLVESVDAQQAHWKPTPKDWSIVEVINHLYDEEIEDFRIRLQITLDDPQAPWPPNEPMRNVTERKYNERNLGQSLENFLDERTVSLAWLRTLDNPNWQNEHRVNANRRLSAGDLLASWVVHDLLHIRQLNELHFAYQCQLFTPFEVSYAGEW